MSRLLGIDYGTKRVGVALSDESGTLAFPHTTLPNDDALCATMTALIEEYNVETIVIGESLNRENEPNAVEEDIQRFIKTLNTNVPIKREPEQYTTQEALRTQGRTNETDAAAAAIILNSYITKERNRTS